MLRVVMRKGALAGVLSIGLAAASAGPAWATDFCVAPATGCAGGQKPTLQQGLDAALASVGPDTVRLPAGTVVGPGAYDTANPDNTVDVVGAGRDATVVTAPVASGYIVDIRRAGTISDLTIKQTVPAQDVALVSGIVDRVGLVSIPGSGGSTFITGTARHVLASGLSYLGMIGTIEDSELSGTSLATWTGDTIVRRVRSVGPSPVYGQNRSLVISSSLFVATDPNGTVASFSPSPVANSQATVVLSNDTFIGGGGSGCVGVGISGDNLYSPPNDFALNSATISSSIVRNCKTTLQRDGGGGNKTANLKVFNSDIDLSPAAVSQSGNGALTAGPGDGNLNVDPLFVGLNGFDQELRFSSPLVDRGLTSLLSPEESATDLNGNPRVVDGNGDGVAKRDVGALEYQRRAPVVQASVSAPTAAIGQAVTFTGSATELDPGETVTGLSWRFDDGGVATGTDAPHAFGTAGTHTATLTATDSAGVTGTAAATVNVVAPPVPSVPTVTSLALSPKAFRAAGRGASTAAAKKKTKRPPLGTTVEVGVNAPVAYTLRVRRLAGGRRSAKGCLAPTRKNRHAKPCTRTIAVRGTVVRAAGARTTFRFTGRIGGRKLAPGSYSLVARAGSTPEKRTAFRIVR